MPKYNSVITILIDDQGNAEGRTKNNDGSSGRKKLKELSGNIYAKVGSNTGDKYRVVSSSGDLQLLDKDGLIRTAKRLENAPKAGECR